MHSIAANVFSPATVSRGSAWGLVAGATIAIPVLVAPHIPPMQGFLNQALALFGWGALLAVLAKALPERSAPWPTHLKVVLAAFALLLAATLATPVWTGQPVSLALCAAGFIVAASLAVVAGTTLQQSGAGELAFSALCVGILVAAMGNACIAVAQIYAPSWLDGYWIAPNVGPRAISNLRQSNHLCTLSLWGIVAVLWLSECRMLRHGASASVALVLMLGVVLSGSRLGLLGVAALALWGLSDRRLNRATRIALLLAPVAYALLWAGTAALASKGLLTFAGEQRFTLAETSAGSRFDLWPNTLALIREHPWTGIGVGEFNLAWTLTPFPVRSGELFGHAHNLPLQFAVEMGLPLAILVLALLGWAFWAAAKNCASIAASGQAPSSTRPALVMLTLVLVHSLLEYPLWYAYFLLPATFMLGLCLPRPNLSEPVAAPAPHAESRTGSILRPAALIVMLGAAFSVQDYLRVTPVYVPPPPTVPSPLSERIAAGQRSLLFPYLADFAAAVKPEHPEAALSAAKRASHNALTPTLMMAFANALHATGDTERARYVAQRLQEFPNAESEAYFAPCKDAGLIDAQRPYQCFAPQRKFTFEDFR